MLLGNKIVNYIGFEGLDVSEKHFVSILKVYE
jgi:hypothetical protein